MPAAKKIRILPEEELRSLIKIYLENRHPGAEIQIQFVAKRLPGRSTARFTVEYIIQ
jgi:hypothetical protein